MQTWIDIPEVQLLAVIFLGFSLGYLFLDRLLNNPFRFIFLSGILFFSVRFIPAFMAIDVANQGVIPGNGIVSASIMWIVYFGAMLLGRQFAKSLGH